MEPFNERLRALRAALKITQQRLAEAGELGRIEVVNLEKGRNQATTIRILKGLAKGFGLSVQDALKFIEGELSVEGAVACVRAGRKRPARAEAPERYPERASAAVLAREDGVWEPAIEAVLHAPVPENLEGRSTLWWALRMRRREAEMLEGHGPAPLDGDHLLDATEDGSRRILKKSARTY